MEILFGVFSICECQTQDVKTVLLSGTVFKVNAWNGAAEIAFDSFQKHQ